MDGGMEGWIGGPLDTYIDGWTDTKIDREREGDTQQTKRVETNNNSTRRFIFPAHCGSFISP